MDRPKRALVAFALFVAGCGSSGSTGGGTGGTAGGDATGGTSQTGSGGTGGFTFPGGDRDAAVPPPPPMDAMVCPGPNCPEMDAAAAICGNGLIEPGEVCDDFNSLPGDGCSGLCRVEPNFRCVVAGEPCLTTIVCGDGKVGGAEGCDDKNLNSGDGCTRDCQVEPGYGCSTPGELCAKVIVVRCGDKIINMGETCEIQRCRFGWMIWLSRRRLSDVTEASPSPNGSVRRRLCRSRRTRRHRPRRRERSDCPGRRSAGCIAGTVPRRRGCHCSRQGRQPYYEPCGRT